MPSPHAALLIVRAWVEEGSSEPLRAEIRLTTDVSAGFEYPITITRPDAIHAVVDAWLGDVLGGQITETPRDGDT